MTDNTEVNKSRLVRLLTRIDFGGRYYDFCDRHAGAHPDPRLSHADHEKAISATGLDFKYDKRERFFGHRESIKGTTLYLNISLAHPDVELILAFDTPVGRVGGTFQGLAAAAEALSRPGCQHQPPYPRLPFRTFDDLHDALQFGVGLYNEVRALIIAETWG